MPHDEVLGQLAALSGLAGLRVLRLELGPEDFNSEEGKGEVSAADALAVLARSHPALEEVRTMCVLVARGNGWGTSLRCLGLTAGLKAGCSHQRPIELGLRR